MSDDLKVEKPLSQHVFERCVAGPNNCIVFVSTRNRKGYGRVERRGKRFLAHRVAYESVNGPIPDGKVIDHLCRNPSCCNPAHLEAVTVAENTRRGNAGIYLKLKAQKMTHCKNGHPRNEYNKRGSSCHTCMLIRQRNRRALERDSREG